jgi:hypothetical protein
MVAYTYTTLRQALLDYTEDDSDEFSSNIPNIIQNAQDRVQRDLDLEIFKQVTTGNFTAGTNLQTRPSTVLYISSLYYYDPTLAKWVMVRPRSYDFCVQYGGGNGKPKYFDQGYADNRIWVALAPDSAYAYRLRGLMRPTYISPTNLDNWIARNAGDLLLYAALVESEKFLMSAQAGKPQEWNEEYMMRLASARPELSAISRLEASPPLQDNREER